MLQRIDLRQSIRRLVELLGHLVRQDKLGSVTLRIGVDEQGLWIGIAADLPP